MSHVVVGAPGVDRYHLVERLVRELTSRGHRATVLCLDPPEFEFWSAQGLATIGIGASDPMRHRAPLAELAEIDCRRLGQRPGGWARERVQARLERLLPGVLRFFEAETPDLVVLHQRRSSACALLQFVAREFGSRVVWTGEGLLPHTMQIDDEGIDGDARAGRRSAWDFRGLATDEPFLAAALAAVLGRNTPPALSRRALSVPPLLARTRAAWSSFRSGADSLLHAFQCWRDALPKVATPRQNFELPAAPFAAVLLQRDDDIRLRLDADGTPTPVALAAGVAAAARRLDPALSVVAVLPERGLPGRQMAALCRVPGIRIETADAAIDAAAAAAIAVTVNDPAAATALLAGTPVVHLGRALYGVRGVAHHGAMHSLPADLAAAIADDQPELRRRFLSWMLAHGHVWCSVEQPDHNGICGLILQVERRLQRPTPVGVNLQYRAGPAWPLAADGR